MSLENGKKNHDLSEVECKRIPVQNSLKNIRLRWSRVLRLMFSTDMRLLRSHPNLWTIVYVLLVLTCNGFKNICKYLVE